MARPDVIIAGAARAGTTNLASALARHPGIDDPTIKEPRYYSTRFGDGEAWYDSLYSGRGLRLDASTQYGYPDFMVEAFERMALPETARIIYLVRNPVERTYSQFCHEHYYHGSPKDKSFGDAVAKGSTSYSASRYDEILPFLQKQVPSGHVLVVPFEALTKDAENVEAFVLRWLGLDPAEVSDAGAPELFQNQRVAISNGFLRKVVHAVRRSRVFPVLRSAVGPARIRKIRNLLTSDKGIPSLDDARARLSATELERLRQLHLDAAAAVDAWLVEQDERLGLDWRSRATWVGTTP